MSYTPNSLLAPKTGDGVEGKLEAAQLSAPSAQGFIQRVVGNPVLLDPLRVSEFEGCLSGMVSHERFEQFMGQVAQDDGYWPRADSWESDYKPYNVRDGILQIPVMGALVNRMGYQVGRYATGYTYIQRAYDRGMADMSVKGIAFVIDSPGGEAAGHFELVDKLVANKKKPVRSFVADAAYSGGYSIATVGDQISVTRSGGTGSVGVVSMHVDMSAYLERSGFKVTFVKAGKHKVDGNRFEPLSASAEKRMQTRIDKIYGVFVSTVAKNRGMSDDAVRETEALTYDADESIEVGFADKIGAIEEELASFRDEAAEDGENQMADKTPNTETITQAALDAAVTSARAEGVAEGAKAGASTERARYAAVQASEEYKGREGLANKMLADTTLSAESITDLLKNAAPVAAAAPDGKPKTARNHFKEHMDATGGAGVEAEGDEGGDEDPGVTQGKQSASILSSFKRAGGKVRAAPVAVK